MGFDMMFGAMEFLFPLVFFLIIGIFIVTIVKGIGTWHKNNNSPQLTVNATVVTKRTSVSHNTHPNAGDPSGMHGMHSTSFTSYFVTFQVESGDRMEFSVAGTQYGMLAEGDCGKLTFQGTRYLSFQRS